MARTYSNPFTGMDMPAFMDFGQFAEQFKVPQIDTTALIEAQRKNLEALTNANRLAFEGAKALTERQAEILRQAMAESTAAVKDLAAGKPEDAMAKQAEWLKQGLERSVENFRELAEIGTKSQHDAAEVINKRISEGLDEMKTAIKKAAV